MKERVMVQQKEGEKKSENRESSCSKRFIEFKSKSSIKKSKSEIEIVIGKNYRAIKQETCQHIKVWNELKV